MTNARLTQRGRDTTVISTVVTAITISPFTTITTVNYYLTDHFSDVTDS